MPRLSSLDSRPSSRTEARLEGESFPGPSSPLPDRGSEDANRAVPSPLSTTSAHHGIIKLSANSRAASRATSVKFREQDAAEEAAEVKQEVGEDGQAGRKQAPQRSEDRVSNDTWQDLHFEDKEKAQQPSMSFMHRRESDAPRGGYNWNNPEFMASLFAPVSPEDTEQG